MIAVLVELFTVFRDFVASQPYDLQPRDCAKALHLDWCAAHAVRVARHGRDAPCGLSFTIIRDSLFSAFMLTVSFCLRI